MNEQALKDRIRIIAKSEKRTFNEVWREIVLERLLIRIAKSKYSGNFIFKGGLLLAHYIDIGRETKDVDFLVKNFDTNISNLENVFLEICSLNLEDGFIFNYLKSIPLEQPHMNYPGFRISLSLTFADKMKDKIQVDVGVGDIVTPIEEPYKLVHYKGNPLFEDLINIYAYPVETIFAEKLETIISKGSANSRMKDYHDLLLLCREDNIMDISKLKNDISQTFENRGTKLLIPLIFAKLDLDLMQKLWIGHRRGLGHFAEILNIPPEIDELIMEINNWLIKKISK